MSIKSKVHEMCDSISVKDTLSESVTILSPNSDYLVDAILDDIKSYVNLPQANQSALKILSSPKLEVWSPAGVKFLSMLAVFTYARFQKNENPFPSHTLCSVFGISSKAFRAASKLTNLIDINCSPPSFFALKVCAQLNIYNPVATWVKNILSQTYDYKLDAVEYSICAVILKLVTILEPFVDQIIEAKGTNYSEKRQLYELQNLLSHSSSTIAMMLNLNSSLLTKKMKNLPDACVSMLQAKKDSLAATFGLLPAGWSVAQDAHDCANKATAQPQIATSHVERVYKVSRVGSANHHSSSTTMPNMKDESAPNKMASASDVQASKTAAAVPAATTTCSTTTSTASPSHSPPLLTVRGPMKNEPPSPTNVVSTPRTASTSSSRPTSPIRQEMFTLL